MEEKMLLLRKTLKRILPRKLTSLILQFESAWIVLKDQRRKETEPFWKGVYANISEIPVQGELYSDSESWITPKTNLINSILNDRSPIGYGVEAGRTLLALVTALIWSRTRNLNREFTIIDVGGDLGTTYALLKNSLPQQVISKFKYYVLELKSCVHAGKEFWKDHTEATDELVFVSEFPDQANPTIVYFGSSIQYFEDYVEILEKSAAAHPEYLLFFNCPIGDVRTHATLQVNVSKFGTPQWKINLNEVCEHLGKHGYELIYKGNNAQNYPVFNFSPEYQLKESSNLLFALKAIS